MCFFYICLFYAVFIKREKCLIYKKNTSFYMYSKLSADYKNYCLRKNSICSSEMSVIKGTVSRTLWSPFIHDSNFLEFIN